MNTNERFDTLLLDVVALAYIFRDSGTFLKCVPAMRSRNAFQSRSRIASPEYFPEVRSQNASPQCVPVP